MAFKLPALLTFALLPVGLIAVYQTTLLAAELQRKAEVSLIGATGEAVGQQTRVFRNASATARAIGALVTDGGTNLAECRDLMDRYVAADTSVSFVGVLPPDGVVACSSADEVIEVEVDSRLADRFEAGVPWFDAIDRPAASGRPVLIAAQPVMVDGELAGFVAASIPRSTAGVSRPDAGRGPALALFTFDLDGAMLTAIGAETATRDTLERLLPQDGSLAEITATTDRVFVAPDDSGTPRVYTVVPLIEGEIYALAVWAEATAGLTVGGVQISAVAFPVAMWLVCLIVASLAVHRLVIRYIRRLSRNMTRFARNRRIPRMMAGDEVPIELREMEEAFLVMARDIVRDEDRLEDSLHEKNALLREVHHRVKNNLQLIASIMNMQMRQSESRETRSVVQRLQDRVLSLAAVHRNLYRADVFSRIEADVLIRDIVEQVLASESEVPEAFDFDADIRRVVLYPDQAVPLTLLTVELLTNAAKYLGAKDGGRGWVTLSLGADDSGRARLSVANSVDPALNGPERDVSRLGSQLIRAYCAQLDSRLELDRSAGEYRASVEFEAMAMTAEDVPAADAGTTSTA